MKNLYLLLAALLMACGSKPSTPMASETQTRTLADPVVYANTITAQELQDHLYTYASDDFEGRETGTEGQKKAIDYLKKDYVAHAIPAAKNDGDYFQKVPLVKAGALNGTISISGKEYTIGEHFATFSASENGTFNDTQIMYLGYGIDSDSYSDYKNMDVTDKIVLIKAGEPKNSNGTYVISGTEETSKWSDLRSSFTDRIAAAKEKGAKGLLFYDSQNFGLAQQQFNFLKARAEAGHGSMNLDEGGEPFFYYFINDDMAMALHSDISTDAAVKTMPTDLTIEVKNNTQKVDSENVVAVIKGVEKPDEFIVISSHLDHIGVSTDGEINNGADDDGSGTVAMLEIAEAFKKAADEGNGPKRSIVFLHVTGEEKGLLGSRYYTDQEPIFPLANTVANLNIDMIGRTDPKREGGPEYVYLIGSDKLSTELHELSEAINDKYAQLELDYTYNDENDPNRFYYRSDHYNFAKNNIPIIFYFNGTHDDYHRPTDTPDKIEYELLAKRTKLVFHTAWEVANRDQRIVVDKATTTAAN